MRGRLPAQRGAAAEGDLWDSGAVGMLPAWGLLCAASPGQRVRRGAPSGTALPQLLLGWGRGFLLR